MTADAAVILQIIPLPVGWWIDGPGERCPALALIEVSMDDGSTRREITPVDEELGVARVYGCGVYYRPEDDDGEHA